MMNQILLRSFSANPLVCFFIGGIGGLHLHSARHLHGRPLTKARRPLLISNCGFSICEFRALTIHSSLAILNIEIRNSNLAIPMRLALPSERALVPSLSPGFAAQPAAR